MTSIGVLKRIWIHSWRYLSWVFPKYISQKAEIIFLTPHRIKRPFSEYSFFESAKKYQILNRYAAFEWGNPKGPIVFLIHGWGGRGTQMGGFIAPLVEKGFRVIALDGPAHGDSFGERTHVGDFVNFLLDAQKCVGPIQAIIAHSFGAGCSVFAASQGMAVEKLVLVAGPSRYGAVVEYFLNRLGLSPQSKNYFFNELAQKVGIPAEKLVVGEVGFRIKIQALIVHDKNDKEVPFSAAEEIKKFWPSAQLLATEGLGHRRILRDAEVVKKVTQFIQGSFPWE